MLPGFMGMFPSTLAVGVIKVMKKTELKPTKTKCCPSCKKLSNLDQLALHLTWTEQLRLGLNSRRSVQDPLLCQMQMEGIQAAECVANAEIWMSKTMRSEMTLDQTTIK